MTFGSPTVTTEPDAGANRRRYQHQRLIDDAAFNKIFPSQFDEFPVQTLVSSRRAFFEWLDGVRRDISESVFVQRINFTLDAALGESLAAANVPDWLGTAWYLGPGPSRIDSVVRTQVFISWDFRHFDSERDKIQAVKSVVSDVPVDVDIIDRVVNAAKICETDTFFGEPVNPNHEIDTHLTELPDWFHREYFDEGTEAFLKAFSEFQKQLKSVEVWASAMDREWSAVPRVGGLRSGYVLPAGAFEFQQTIEQLSAKWENLQNLADHIYTQSCAENVFHVETDDDRRERDALIVLLCEEFWNLLGQAHEAANATFFDQLSESQKSLSIPSRQEIRRALRQVEASCWYPNPQQIVACQSWADINEMVCVCFVNESKRPRSSVLSC